MPQQPVFVVVSGGVVQDCPHFVGVIDFDNLLPDVAAVYDSRDEWEALSAGAQEHVKEAYPDEYKKIQDRIAHDEKVSA